MIVVDIILWVLIVALSLVMILLLAPIQFAAAGSASDDEGVDWRVRGAWALGLVSASARPDGFRLKLLGITLHHGPLRTADEDLSAEALAKRERKKAAKAAKAERKKAKREGKSDHKGSRGLSWAYERREALANLIRRALGLLHLRGHMRGSIGLESPEHTAKLHQALVFADAVLPGEFLQVDVNWVEAEVDVEGATGGWVWPIQVLVFALSLYLNPITRRTLRAA